MEKKSSYNLEKYYNHNFLTDRLNYYLEFAFNTLDHLVSKNLSLPKDSKWYVRHEKIIAETSYFLLYAKAGLKQKIHLETFNKTLKKVESFARNEKVLLNIALNPALVLDYSFPHICLSKLGSKNKRFDDIVKSAINQDYDIERRPYRELEQSWINSLYDQKNTFDWKSKSVLSKKINIFSNSADMAYALTHAIMYSNFLSDEQNITPTKELNQTIEALLVKYIEKQDYDVAGELVLAWLLLNDHVTEIIAFGITCLFEIDQIVGFLPAPNLDTKYILDQDLEDRKTYIYSINYHTSYVMGMIISLMNNKKIPPQESHQKRKDPVKKISSSKTLNKNPKQWEEIRDQLMIHDNQLQTWNSIVTIFRKIEKHEYAKLKTILSDDTKGSHIVDCQARELLQRLSLTANYKINISA